MDGLDANALLDLWERGLSQPLPRRAVTLLRASWPDATEGDVLEWPVGLRDARLLSLRRWLFGPDLTVVSLCPSCGESVESTFRVDDVLLDRDATSNLPPPADGTIVIERQGFVVTFRPPVSGDLLALAEAPADAEPAPRERLLARCVLDVRAPDGSQATLAGVPDGITADIVARMSVADPQADVQLACVCPACRGAWPAVFDIATVLWNEIHSWARHLLLDVHVLARAYGWREADVLALSPTRRRIYLELVGP